jgi:hypothetical protein
MAVLSLRSLLAERQHAAVLLGTQAAETAMKRRIQREGRIKLLTLPLSTITRLAREHLQAQAHPELYAEALASDISTQESLICRRFHCANIKLKMEALNDCWLRSRLN